MEEAFFFSCKEPLVVEFLYVIRGHILSLEKNKLIWKLAMDGIFSMSTTYQSLLASSTFYRHSSSTFNMYLLTFWIVWHLLMWLFSPENLSLIGSHIERIYLIERWSWTLVLPYVLFVVFQSSQLLTYLSLVTNLVVSSIWCSNG